MANFNYLKPLDETSIVCEAIRGLCDIAKCHDHEVTERYRIRQQCEQAVKIIEKQADILKAAIEAAHIERMSVVNNLGNLYLKPTIGEYELKLAERTFDYLISTSPMAVLNAAPTILRLT